MKKNNFRIIPLVLIIGYVLIAFCLPVMGTGTKEQAAVTGNYRFTYTVGWDIAQGAIPPEKAPEDPHFQFIEKKLGVVPLTQPYDWNGGLGYEQQVRMQLTGGKIPEAMELFSEEFVAELIGNGVLIPLDTFLPKYAPTVWNMLTAEQWDMVRAFSPDRKIYFVPLIDKEPRVGLIRKDWLKRCGINKVPSTVEELLAAYQAFLDKDANGNGDPNDEIPVSGREYLRWLDDLFVMHGVAMIEGTPQWHWNAAKKQFISDQVSDEMKNAVAFLRMLYQKGYMDKTMPILKGAEWFAKIEKDTVGHYFHTIGGMERRLAMRIPGKDGKALNPEAEFVYMPNVKVGNLPHQKNFALGLRPAMAITIKARDPGKILKWYEWGFSQEGRIYQFYGIEGLNYKKDAAGKIVIDSTVKPISNKHLYIKKAAGKTKEIYAALPNGDQMAAVFEASKDDGQFLQNTFMPVKVYEGYEDYSPMKAPLYQERCSKIIMGELPMEAWDQYVKEWYEKGGKVVTERATQWYISTHSIK